MNIEMLNDPNGKTSSTRITLMGVTFIVMIVWAKLSIYNGYMIDINPGVLGVIASFAANGAVKSFAEHRSKKNNA